MTQTIDSRPDGAQSAFSRRGLWRAVLTLAAVIASFGCTFAACRAAGADSQPAIVAAFIALSLSLRTVRSRAHPLLHAAALMAIAPLAAATGLLLHASPLLGAAAFTAIMGCSVWARDWGGFAARLGTLAALPLLAILIVPPPAHGAPGGPWVDLALVTGGGLIALLWVSIFQRLGARTGGPAGGTPSPGESATRGDRKTAVRPGSRFSVAQRMALQMAVALAAAFAVGFVAFPGHWGWTVLTAFIVCSGARGRGDAAYKGILRLIGALGGTVAAALIGTVVAPRGITAAIAVFGVLFIGVLLREVNYAYWAGCMTLVLALLAGGNGSSGVAGLLGLRLLAIVAGALCAVASAWFVFPIRTEAVIRRRLADTLLALDELVVAAHGSSADHAGRLAHFDARLTELEGVAPPVEWHRRIFRRAGANEHPAGWIDRTRALRQHVRSLAAGDEPQRVRIRRAIGASRKAIAAHGKSEATPGMLPISAALDQLHETLAATSASNT